jgi:hypothetical protein
MNYLCYACYLCFALKLYSQFRSTLRKCDKMNLDTAIQKKKKKNLDDKTYWCIRDIMTYHQQYSRTITACMVNSQLMD